jgi:hypothetical protein
MLTKKEASIRPQNKRFWAHVSWQRSLRVTFRAIVVYLTSSCVNWVSETSVLKAHECRKTQFTRVEYVSLFDEPLKGSKSLKIFKISLTFRFDKLWHLSKSVHTGENSQIVTVANKKNDVKDGYFFEKKRFLCNHLKLLNPKIMFNLLYNSKINGEIRRYIQWWMRRDMFLMKMTIFL